jgi:carbon storage regulator
MLVLSRRLGQKIVFPGLNVAVQVVLIDGGKVRLGIEAPSDVVILREELWKERNEPVAEPLAARPSR